MKNLNPSVLAVAMTAALLSQNAFANQSQTEVVTVTGQRIVNEQQISLDSNRTIAPDFSDSIVNLPGVNVNTNGGATRVLQYRGLFGDRVNIEIDGAPITGAGPNAMDSPLSHVIAQPHLAVTLFRGIAPVSAGPETLGGHVELKTDTNQYLFNEGNVFGGISTLFQNGGDIFHSNGSLGFGTDKGYGLVSFTRQKADELADGDNRQIPNYQYDRTGGKLAFGLRHNDHALDVSYQTLRTDNAGTPALGMDILYIDANWYRLQYQYSSDDHSGVEVTLFGNQNDHGMDNVSQRNTMNPMARLNTVDANSLGLELSGFTQTNFGRLHGGIEIAGDEHNSLITNPILQNLNIANFNDVTRDSYSIFSELSNRYQDWNWLVGTRYTQVNSDAGNVSSTMAMMNSNVATLVNTFNQSSRDITHDLLDLTLHASVDVNSSTTAYMALGQKSRAPSYTELYTWLPLTISAGLADGFTYLGNLALDHETSRQIDLGIDWQNNQISLSANAYYQQVDDYIVGVPAMNPAATMITMMMGNTAPLQWQNVDATLWGAEVSGQYQANEVMTFGFTASIVRGQRDDIDDNLFRIAPDNLRAHMRYLEGPLDLKLEAQLAKKQTRVSALQREQTSPGYGIVNASVGYQFSSKMRFGLNLHNLFDKTYQPHLAGINRVANVDINVGDRLFAPGRQVVLSISYHFGS